MLIAFLEFLEWYLERSGSDPDVGPLRVFYYISVRMGGALIFAFVLSLLIGPRTIGLIRAIGAGQVIRRAKSAGAISLHDMHGAKEGTPSMGGFLILATMLSSVLVFCRLGSGLVWLLIAVSIAFAGLGFYDDYQKIAKRNHLGLSARGKILGQTCIGVLLALALMFPDWDVSYAPTDSQGYDYLLIPFLKNLYLPLGFGFILLVVLVTICTSNAVNLTDGLDGLAIGTTLTSTAAFAIMAYFASRADYAGYLFVPHVPGASEIVVFGGALFGASLGFLWFNSHPAEIFMGDTGSMMLGGLLGAIALAIKQELLLVLVGGIFVVEALSVIIQVGSFKLRGKRVFLMSPLHHHFEKKGLHESKIIIRFWTISILLALLGIATLKLR